MGKGQESVMGSLASRFKMDTGRATISSLLITLSLGVGGGAHATTRQHRENREREGASKRAPFRAACSSRCSSRPAWAAPALPRPPSTGSCAACGRARGSPSRPWCRCCCPPCAQSGGKWNKKGKESMREWRARRPHFCPLVPLLSSLGGINSAQENEWYRTVLLSGSEGQKKHASWLINCNLCNAC